MCAYDESYYYYHWQTVWKRRHEVGNRLSERLNIPLYDNNLISMAAHELSISQEAAEKVDETILGKFLSAYV